MSHQRHTLMRLELLHDSNMNLTFKTSYETAPTSPNLQCSISRDEFKSFCNMIGWHSSRSCNLMLQKLCTSQYIAIEELYTVFSEIKDTKSWLVVPMIGEATVDHCKQNRRVVLTQLKSSEILLQQLSQHYFLVVTGN